MTRTPPAVHAWKDSIRTFFHPRVLTMFFLGFSAGLPILIIFSSLAPWLNEAGIDRASITFFSWASLGYSFKFIWAPLIDRLPVPVLTRWLGRRRSWMFLSQILIFISIVLMAMIDPSRGSFPVSLMFAAAILLGFFSATQDIVIDAYRIESATVEYQAMMASAYVAGYRIAMIFSGAGTLFLADHLGSTMGSYRYHAWKWAYLIMSSGMAVGVVTSLIIPEPDVNKKDRPEQGAGYYARFLTLFILSVSGFILTFYISTGTAVRLKDYLSSIYLNPNLAGICIEGLRFALALFMAYGLAEMMIRTGFVKRDVVFETYIAPVSTFFERYGNKLAFLLLALIGLYRISDSVLGIMSNVFYQDMGFTKTEIAAISKTFGLCMTIFGGFVGGVLSHRYGVYRILFAGAFFSSASCLLFMALAKMGHSVPMLYVAISSDNLAGGIASAAFIAFLSSLTDIKFTAMQYALFSSLMTLIPKVIGGYSGTMVNNLGYPVFFLITALLGVPVLFLVFLAGKYLQFSDGDKGKP